MNNSQNSIQYTTIKKTKNLCKQLKNIANEIEEIIKPSSSLPTQQNNERVAGVSGSIMDNSYRYWTSSLRS